MTRFAFSVALVVTLLAPAWARAQGSKADYERAASLRQLYADKVFKTRVEPHWIGAGRFWYRNDLADGKRQSILVDCEKAERRPAFDHAKLAAALSKSLNKPCDAERLPIDDILAADEVFIVLNAGGKTWRCNLASYALAEADAKEFAAAPPASPAKEKSHLEEQPGPREQSPDGKWVAFIRDHNVFIRPEPQGPEVRLTSDGKEGDAYTSAFFWSADSRKLVAMKRIKGQEHKVYLVESSPADQVQPKLHTLDYIKPGDLIPITKPHLFDVAAKKELPVSDALFPNPWELEGVRWGPDSSRFTFFYNQRGHQVARIIAVDAASGEARPIVNEECRTFFDYEGKLYFRYLDETQEIIWMSERDGYNHLFLYDARSGAVKNCITPGNLVIRDVQWVDEAHRQVWFRAGGVYPQQDPYYLHYCRADLDGKGVVVMTEADGTHDVQFSPDRRWLIDTWSRVDQPPVTELRRSSDGKLVCELEKADASALVATGWKAPERFVAKGRDGTTDIYGLIHRPSNFDPARKYPVIEEIYAGPQEINVFKDFRPFFWVQTMADLGFIVVQIDGMGTNYRSKAFHDVCWKNLVDAGFPDRILWMKAAAAKYPYMDLSRVGIYGGSAGGQNAAGALFTHPEFYKVAVADCGCHDNRMDKIWWNEQWMGWPIGPHYIEQSNVTLAKNLQGKLMLVVGELDRNVDPASTMQVVNALIKADKDFDLLVVPGSDHGACESPYGKRRRQDFFVRHLLGVEPRHD